VWHLQAYKERMKEQRREFNNLMMFLANLRANQLEVEKII